MSSQTRALHLNADQLHHLRAAAAAAYNLAVYQAGNNAEALRTPLTDDERARARRLLRLNSERRDTLAEVLTNIDNM